MTKRFATSPAGAQTSKAHQATADALAERERALRHAIALVNHVLASPVAPDPSPLLRQILAHRATAVVNKNRLPDLF